MMSMWVTYSHCWSFSAIHPKQKDTFDTITCQTDDCCSSVAPEMRFSATLSPVSSQASTCPKKLGCLSIWSTHFKIFRKVTTCVNSITKATEHWTRLTVWREHPYIVASIDRFLMRCPARATIAAHVKNLQWILGAHLASDVSDKRMLIRTFLDDLSVTNYHHIHVSLGGAAMRQSTNRKRSVSISAHLIAGWACGKWEYIRSPFPWSSVWDVINNYIASPMVWSSRWDVLKNNRAGCHHQISNHHQPSSLAWLPVKSENLISDKLKLVLPVFDNHFDTLSTGSFCAARFFNPSDIRNLNKQLASGPKRSTPVHRISKFNNLTGVLRNHWLQPLFCQGLSRLGCKCHVLEFAPLTNFPIQRLFLRFRQATMILSAGIVSRIQAELDKTHRILDSQSLYF